MPSGQNKRDQRWMMAAVGPSSVGIVVGIEVLVFTGRVLIGVVAILGAVIWFLLLGVLSINADIKRMGERR